VLCLRYGKDLDYKGLSDKSIISSTVKSNFFRILREMMWKSKKWKSEELSNWITDFSPDIVFFCSGDTAFAYDIVSFVLDKTDAKLVTYITDDYVLPRRTISLLWWIRRNYIFKKMNRAILSSDLFMTISEQMQIAYKELFNKDSTITLNMTESMKIEGFNSNNYENNNINFIYAGGLHFKRYETLSLLAEAINKYNNQSTDTKAFLSIYSTIRPIPKVLRKLNIKGASKFLGGLNVKELKDKLNEADILVHVESFDIISIEATRLSISTKIPEYLSLGKPILAIGPKEVASMIYLKDVAYCITCKNGMSEKLSKLVNDNKIKNNISMFSLNKYKTNHDSEEIREKFEVKIVELLQK
jgi:glycosyltransferase involved in cell wall biosynthesis